MADYYSLLARAVGNLPQSTTDTRRAIYERARAALLGQLRNLSPPAPESAIDNESRALDTAIERLEAEIADKHRAQSADLAPTPTPVAEPATTGTFPTSNTFASDLAAAGPLQLKPRFAAPVRPNPALQPDAKPTGRPMPPRPAPRLGDEPPRSRARFWIIAAVGGVVIAAIAIAAAVLPNAPFNKAAFKPATLAPTEQPDAKAGKIGGRIGGGSSLAEVKRPPEPTVAAKKPPPAPPVENAPGPAATGASAALPVSQSAALLVQTGETPQSVKAYVGSVVWRIETASPGSAQPLQNIIRADVDVPEAHFKAVITMQNNLDAALPASHTMSIQFIEAPDSPVGTIKAIDVPEMREAGAPSGERLIGTSVAITPNNFLAALARGDAIVPRNLELIRNRAWFDVPMQLENNKLAKLTLEKGPSGDRVIADALASWAK